MVLNRDPADKLQTSTSDVTNSAAGTQAIFDGTKSSKPSLFGAYKMGHWIDSLKIGAAANYDTVIQPLFSGVFNRTACTVTAEGGGEATSSESPSSPTVTISGGVVTDSYIYLFEPIKAYDGIDSNNIACDLTEVDGDLFHLPKYAFNGCEELETITLPDATADPKYLPEGVFANNNNASLKYATTDDSSTAGLLDLTSSGYTKIAKDTFRNNKAITKFVAPNVSSFTLDESCFEGCENLEEIDLSNVTGFLQLNKNCFKDCKLLTTITWPASPTEVRLDKDGSFRGCEGLTTVTLPANLSKSAGEGSTARSLGKNLFNGCINLETVSFAGDEPYISSIGECAFSGCTKLQFNNFDFDSLTASSVTIGKQAFMGAGSLADADTYGALTLTSNITTFKEECFKNANVKIVTFGCATITFEKNAFFDCNSLEGVRFSNHGCAWGGTTEHLFSECEKLKELQLPTGHSLNYDTTTMVNKDTNVKIYTFKKDIANLSKTKWRKTGSGDAPIYWFIEGATDLVTQGVIETGVSGVKPGKGSILFWMLDGAAAKKLGTVSYNGALIEFSESDYKITWPAA